VLLLSNILLPVICLFHLSISAMACFAPTAVLVRTFTTCDLPMPCSVAIFMINIRNESIEPLSCIFQHVQREQINDESIPSGILNSQMRNSVPNAKRKPRHARRVRDPKGLIVGVQNRACLYSGSHVWFRDGGTGTSGEDRRSTYPDLELIFAASASPNL